MRYSLAIRATIINNIIVRSKYRKSIIRLRQCGRSYNEIARILGISKGTVSYWLRGIRLTHVARKRLEKNIDNARKKGLFAFNIMRSRAIKRENIMIRQAARQEIKKLSLKDLFLVGVALYWAEGTKSENIRTSDARLSFANSDPHMIAIFMRFIRENLKISDVRVRAAIHIHPNLGRRSAVQYWSKVTGLPGDHFVIINRTSRASRYRRPLRSLPYGTVHIRINDRKLFFRMNGWIDGLSRSA